MGNIPQEETGFNTPALRRCSKCHAHQERDQFHVNRKIKDGLALHCKACVKAYCELKSVERAAKARQWQKDNPERAAEANRAYRKANKNAISSRHRKAYQEKAMQPGFRDEQNAYRRDWLRAGGKNNEREIHRRYARRKAMNGGELARDEWEYLLYKYHGKCCACGATGVLEPDHIIPVSKGGTNDIDNRQPLCRSCNAKKRDRIADFRYDYSSPIRSLEE